MFVMPLTIDDIPDWFFGQVLKKNRSATVDDIMKAYEEEQGSGSSVPKKRIDRISRTPPLVRLAFDLDYIGGETNHSLEHFILHVSTVYEAWKSLHNRYYSPYFAFFQSSGSGKSKLFNSLTDSYWICYVSFATEKAYPQTPLLKQSLLSKECKELDLTYYFSYFCAVLQSWNQAQERNPKGHQSWSKKWFNDEKVVDESIIEEHMGQIAKFGEEEDFEKYARELFDAVIDETRFPLIIVFDEAHAMVATGDFGSVRRALRYFTKGVVAVFADTMSSLSNFSPSAEADPSFRPRTYMELFPPFYQLCTFDLFARRKNYLDCEIWEYGRVMWAAFKSCGMTEGDLVAFAQSKLLGGHEQVETLTTMTPQVAIAMLSSFASIEITPSSSLSKQVVAGNMAMCLHVSHDRSSIMARYPSDPVLTEAAAKLVQDTFNHEKRMQILRLLASSLTNGLVERGKRGELIGSLIIGLAMQKCQKARFQKRMPFRYSQAVSLEDFLNVFIDVDEKSSDARLENVYVKFSHAWKISRGANQQLSKALLKAGWHRGCYFLCEENQEAIDVVIPTSHNANSYEDGPPLLIQIKNQSGRGAIRDAFLKFGSAKLDAIKPELDEVTFVGLLLSFGARMAKSERISFNTGSKKRKVGQSYSVDEEDFESLRYGIVYGVYGSRCFQNLFEIVKENDEIAAAIGEILDAFPDPMKKELPSLLQDDECYCTYNNEFLITTTLIQNLAEKE